MTAPDDPFEILGLPKRFTIDRAVLRTARLRRLAMHHPDRVTDPVARAEAVRQSAIINDAHAALESDERRANILLSLLGGAMKEDDRALPEGFLVEMMETRERIEETLQSGSDDEVAAVEAWVDERRREALGRVASLFDRATGACSDDLRRETLAEIRRELNAWRYIERLRDQLRPAPGGGPGRPG